MAELGLTAKVHGLHAALEAAAIPHAFGGALALAYCTQQPRGTIDIDVNVFVAPEGATAAFGALPGGVAWSPADVGRVERDGQVRLWWARTPVDLFFSTDPFHDEAAQHARAAPLAGVDLPMLACDHLAVFKAMFGRTKDWADLEAMATAGALGERAVAWLGTLLGPDDPAVARLDELRRLGRTASPEPRFRRR